MRIVQRLQETEYGRKRIEIARKREVDAKKSVEAKKPEAAPKPAAKAAAQPAEKKVRRVQPPAPQEAMPTPAPSSRFGITRPAEDPHKILD